MTTTSTVSSGQVFTGSAVSGEIVLVSSGGIASDATVLPGGTLTVASGGMAQGTVVAGGSVDVDGGTVAATDVAAGAIEVFSGGMATGTIVGSGASDIIFSAGLDLGASIESGGFLTVSAGTASGPALAPGASALVGSNYLDEGAAIVGATVSGNDGITTVFDGMVSSVTLNPGTFLDLDNVVYAPGGTAVLNGTTDVLTVTEGGTVTPVQLAGSYAGDTFSVVSDRGFPYEFSAAGTIIEVTSGGLPDGAFGFDKTGENATFPLAFYGGTYIPAAADIQVSAYQDIAAAGAGGAVPGVYATTLDGNGDQAIYSTIDSTGHIISASGTGQSLIAAGNGADTVTVNNGADLIATGTGSTTLYLVTGSNTLQSEGNDVVYLGAGADTINIGANATVTGGDARLHIGFTLGGSLTLHTGTGPVTVQGSLGSGAFSGGTDGNNLLVAGTGPTTLYAGGNGDELIASGGSQTTMDGWGGSEQMLGQYSQGLDTFNFNAANVFAVGGAGQNVFNIGSGVNAIVAGTGTDTFNITNGSAGQDNYIANFTTRLDHIHLAGYAPDEVSHALDTATTYQGSEILTLRDGTVLSFLGVTGLTQASFTS